MQVVAPAAPSSSQAIHHQGYARAPRYATQPARVPFHGGLLDFSFTTYVTTRFVKILYALHLAFVGLWTLAFVGAGVIAIESGGNNSRGASPIKNAQAPNTSFSCEPSFRTLRRSPRARRTRW